MLLKRVTVTVIVNLQGCITGTHCASQGSEARSLTPMNESLTPSKLPYLTTPTITPAA